MWNQNLKSGHTGGRRPRGGGQPGTLRSLQKQKRRRADVAGGVGRILEMIRYFVSRYRRSPSSPFVDSTVSPIFLPTAPLMNPRTECGCQPVDFMISAKVAPFGRRIISSTLAVLLSARGVPAFFAGAGLATFFPALAAFFGAAPLVLPDLAAFWLLGAPFLGLAPFFGEAFSGATCAPCAATVAALSALAVVSVLFMFVFVPFLRAFRAHTIHHSGALERQVNSPGGRNKNGRRRFGRPASPSDRLAVGRVLGGA